MLLLGPLAAGEILETMEECLLSVAKAKPEAVKSILMRKYMKSSLISP